MKYQFFMPIYVQIPVVLLLLMLSALFSGLNLGLMTLDPLDLMIIQEAGDRKEKRMAKKIYPVRQRSNLLLCSLLLGNTMVNAALTLLSDNLLNAIEINSAVASFAISVGIPTFLIVIFAEIVPQAICSRKGLAVGAHTIVLTKLLIGLTFVVAYPISWILDKTIGGGVHAVYDRARLLALIDHKATLSNHPAELQIVKGALNFPNKTVQKVMTAVEEVYMLSTEDRLVSTTLAKILKAGFTRVPVYKGTDPNNIVYVMNVKFLALVNPQESTSVESVCHYWRKGAAFVFDNTPLKLLLHEFCKGKHHMAIVLSGDVISSADSETDDYNDQLLYAASIGIVTLEDVIEDILQMEITDETDLRRHRRQPGFMGWSRRLSMTSLSPARPAAHGHAQDQLDILLESSVAQAEEVGALTNKPASVGVKHVISAAQILPQKLTEFTEKYLSNSALHWLIAKGIHRWNRSDSDYDQFYQEGKTSDVFTLIVEGWLSVSRKGPTPTTTVAGPHNYFGLEAIQQAIILSRKNGFRLLANEKAEFCSTYTVQLTTLNVVLLRISAVDYLKACKRSADTQPSATESAIQLRPADSPSIERRAKPAEPMATAPIVVPPMRRKPKVKDKPKTEKTIVRKATRLSEQTSPPKRLTISQTQSTSESAKESLKDDESDEERDVERTQSSERKVQTEKKKKKKRKKKLPKNKLKKGSMITSVVTPAAETGELTPITAEDDLSLN